MLLLSVDQGQAVVVVAAAVGLVAAEILVVVVAAVAREEVGVTGVTVCEFLLP
jgi:hypothetical protein